MGTQGPAGEKMLSLLREWVAIDRETARRLREVVRLKREGVAISEELRDELLSAFDATKRRQAELQPQARQSYEEAKGAHERGEEVFPSLEFAELLLAQREADTDGSEALTEFRMWSLRDGGA